MSVMKSRAWLLTLFLLVTLVFPAGAQDEISDLLGRVNNLRASLGLAAYGFNGALAAAAQDQAQWMVNSGSISHTRPDGSTPRSRAAAAGYPSTWVSENIYGGSNATANDAWGFWMNSSIHYAGITSANSSEIGIGAAHGSWGAAYVLVFGNPGGQVAQPRSSNGGNTANGAAAVPQQPVYVIGTDEHGNIMHEIQPADTMGDIALIYGYTWEDIPAILALNNLTEEDFRNLEIGAILLIPPQSGTYTPTPGEPTATVTYMLPATFTSTPTPTLTPLPGANPPDRPTSDPGDQGILPTLTPTPTPYTRAIVTSNAVPAAVALAVPAAPETPTLISTEPLPAETAVASVLTAPVSAPAPSVIITPEGTSPWLIAGLVLQVGVLAYASFEFVRRIRRR
jgi:hypothetical protein